MNYLQIGIPECIVIWMLYNNVLRGLRAVSDYVYYFLEEKWAEELI